jgi:hypothetical protein|tara:strand:+ start:359 stop:526 length:168 start_codon:yes stop_codon:yes gene_type:complete
MSINETAVDIATDIVEHQMGTKVVWVTDENGNESFSEEAQDLFNELLEIVEVYLT